MAEQTAQSSASPPVFSGVPTSPHPLPPPWPTVLGWGCEPIAYVTKEIIGMSSGGVIFLATYSRADCNSLTYRPIIQNARSTAGPSPPLVLQAGTPCGEGEVQVGPALF